MKLYTKTGITTFLFSFCRLFNHARWDDIHHYLVIASTDGSHDCLAGPEDALL